MALKAGAHTSGSRSSQGSLVAGASRRALLRRGQRAPRFCLAELSLAGLKLEIERRIELPGNRAGASAKRAKFPQSLHPPHQAAGQPFKFAIPESLDRID